MEPFNTFSLRVSDLHQLYVEESGNPKGYPIVFLHGGPGGGTTSLQREFFDPKFYRIILYDQRGCGKSLPFAELRENTTWDLVDDLEKIRKHLGISKWHVFGGSWGSTLALCYAIKYPQVISALLLRGIFLCRHLELQWFYQSGASMIFPDFWEKYKNFIPADERDDFISAYYRRLTSADKTLQLQAARVWSQWEAATSYLYVNEPSIAEYADPHKALPFARIEAHYFVNNAFLKSDNQILENASQFQNIPGRIVQGRYDVVCPVRSAFDLHHVWKKSELVVVPDSGHSAFEPGIKKDLIRACEDFKVFAN